MLPTKRADTVEQSNDRLSFLCKQWRGPNFKSRIRCFRKSTQKGRSWPSRLPTGDSHRVHWLILSIRGWAWVRAWIRACLARPANRLRRPTRDSMA